MARRTAEQTTGTKTAIGYVRVSTDKQAGEGVSLDAQRAKLEAYASLYGYELAHIYVDAGASAKTLDRPALADALAALDRGEASAIIVAKLDRLTRSVRDLDELIQRSNRRGWSLVSVAEQLDTGSAAGRLVLNVLASVAQWDREALGERTAAALAHKASRGEYTGGEAPYGWTVGPDGVHLEEDDAEQEVIAAARRARAAGLSLRAIARELAAAGLRPRNGKAWHPPQIARMLEAR